MEAPVRNPRIESELDRTRSSPQLRTRQGARLLRSVPKFGRGERNFPTQRPDAKIQPRGGYCPAETENVKTGATIPAQRASFKSITVLEVRADCVVVCAVLCEPVSLLFALKQGDFRQKQRKEKKEMQKRPAVHAFLRFLAIKEQGETGWRPDGKQGSAVCVSRPSREGIPHKAWGSGSFLHPSQIASCCISKQSASTVKRLTFKPLNSRVISRLICPVRTA
jgi:hypothetical protein